MGEPQSCLRCGCSGDPGAPLLTWMFDRMPDGGQLWTCGDCVRSRLPEIEGRLDGRLDMTG